MEEITIYDLQFSEIFDKQANKLTIFVGKDLQEESFILKSQNTTIHKFKNGIAICLYSYGHKTVNWQFMCNFPFVFEQIDDTVYIHIKTPFLKDENDGITISLNGLD